MSDMLTTGTNAAFQVAVPSTGETIDLKDYAGKDVVLYFYPKDDTPGCTKEASRLSGCARGVRRSADVPVLAISPDPG